MHLAESEELEQPEFQYNFNSSQFHAIGRFEKKLGTTSQKPSFFVHYTLLCALFVLSCLRLTRLSSFH